MEIEPMKIRKPNVAGMFYPADKATLTAEMKSYFDSAAKPPVALKNKRIRALICPHAGYVYSGTTAASGYQLLKNSDYKKVILIGPSHYVSFSFAALDNAEEWQSSLGEISLAQELNNQLRTNKNFEIYPLAYKKELSLDVLIPFLQTVLKKSELVPICCGQNVNIESIAQTINEIIDDKTLLVISSDLSHYLPLDSANKIDNRSIETILSMDQKQIEKYTDACGLTGILILNIIAKLNGWKPHLINHRTSGEASGDNASVVGYGSIAYI